MTDTVSTALSGRPRRSDGKPLGVRVLAKPVGAVCVLFLLATVAVAVLAPILLPGVAAQQAGDILQANQGPSAAHLLGTDMVGRDVLQRLLVGTTPSLSGVFEAVVVVTVLGIPLGLLAGYFGGWIDRAVVWAADLVFSVPTIAIIIVVLAIFPSSLVAAMLTFGVLAAPALARVIRAATLSSRRELYVDGARVAGLSDGFIIVRHVMPRVAGVIVVQLSFLAAVALSVQVGLSFLRLVVANPAPSWGGMIADGVTMISGNPWLIWPPGIAVALTIVAFSLLGDVVRDALVEPWTTGGGDRTRASVRLGRAAKLTPLTTRGDELLRVSGLGVSAVKAGGDVVRLVDDVGFHIRRGECVGLVGESGCGKSITAGAVLGVLPPGAFADAGGIAFEGTTGPWNEAVRSLRGSRIALISQEPSVSLDPAYTVGSQLVESIRVLRGATRGGARSKAMDLLRAVELPDAEAIMRRYPHELSGGMAQRVAIARALAGDPELLVADEPTTALDVTVQAEVLNLLMRLREERGMSILLITHDWGVVARTCDRAIVMYAGQVVEEAEIADVFAAPRHPYTRALLVSDPHRAQPGTVLPAIEGVVPAPESWPAGCRFADRCPLATEACRLAPIELTHLPGERRVRCIRSDVEVAA